MSHLYLNVALIFISFTPCIHAHPQLCSRLFLEGLHFQLFPYAAHFEGTYHLTKKSSINSMPVFKHDTKDLQMVYQKRDNKGYIMFSSRHQRKGSYRYLQMLVKKDFTAKLWLPPLSSTPFSDIIDSWHYYIPNQNSTATPQWVNFPSDSSPQIVCAPDHMLQCSTRTFTFSNVVTSSQGDTSSRMIGKALRFQQTEGSLENLHPVFRSWANGFYLYFGSGYWSVGSSVTSQPFMRAHDQAYHPEFISAQWEVFMNGQYRLSPVHLVCSSSMQHEAGHPNPCQNNAPLHHGYIPADHNAPLHHRNIPADHNALLHHESPPPDNNALIYHRNIPADQSAHHPHTAAPSSPVQKDTTHATRPGFCLCKPGFSGMFCEKKEPRCPSLVHEYSSPSVAALVHEGSHHTQTPGDIVVKVCKKDSPREFVESICSRGSTGQLYWQDSGSCQRNRRSGYSYNNIGLNILLTSQEKDINSERMSYDFFRIWKDNLRLTNIDNRKLKETPHKIQSTFSSRNHLYSNWLPRHWPSSHLSVHSDQGVPKPPGANDMADTRSVLASSSPTSDLMCLDNTLRPLWPVILLFSTLTLLATLFVVGIYRSLKLTDEKRKSAFEQKQLYMVISTV